MGKVDEPWDLLARTKAVALITRLGFGMKTTIVDALAAGCNVLIHAGLAKRLPSEIRAACIVVDPESRDSVRSALRRAEQQPVSQDVNGQLRAAALAGFGQC